MRNEFSHMELQDWLFSQGEIVDFESGKRQGFSLDEFFEMNTDNSGIVLVDRLRKAQFYQNDTSAHVLPEHLDQAKTAVLYDGEYKQIADVVRKVVCDNFGKFYQFHNEQNQAITVVSDVEIVREADEIFDTSYIGNYCDGKDYSESETNPFLRALFEKCGGYEIYIDKKHNNKRVIFPASLSRKAFGYFVERNTYKYFRPCQSMLEVFKYYYEEKNLSFKIARKKAWKSVESDLSRMEAFNNGDWHFLTVHARACVHVSNNGGKTFVREVFKSGHVSGIESDGGKDYFDEIYGEHLNELKAGLVEFGCNDKQVGYEISKHEIRDL